MPAPPAIAGVYADLRQVKSRGVWQLVIDVPAEKVEGMVKLFGMPRQDEPTWLGIARLKSSPSPASVVEPARILGAAGEAEAAPRVATQSASAGGGEHKPKRERTLAEKVGMRCGDKKFWDWLYSKGRVTGSAEDAAHWVRLECGVDTRALILPGTEAAKKWLALETQYLAETGQMAEERR